LSIRPAAERDKDAIWAILEPMIRRGETYPLPRDMTMLQAMEFWFAPENETFVWEADGSVLGTYFLRANQRGGGSHVANCGYVTATAAEGQGSREPCASILLSEPKSAGFWQCNSTLW
jgi:L-amino acid N-acyltransferase YncA